MIGMALGRPSLVHPQLLQCQHNQDFQYDQRSTALISVESIAGQAYLSTLGYAGTHAELR